MVYFRIPPTLAKNERGGNLPHQFLAGVLASQERCQCLFPLKPTETSDKNPTAFQLEGTFLLVVLKRKRTPPTTKHQPNWCFLRVPPFWWPPERSLKGHERTTTHNAKSGCPLKNMINPTGRQKRQETICVAFQKLEPEILEVVLQEKLQKGPMKRGALQHGSGCLGFQSSGFSGVGTLTNRYYPLYLSPTILKLVVFGERLVRLPCFPSGCPWV